MVLSVSAGTTLVVAALACAAGVLLPPVIAVVVAAVLAMTAIAAFAVRRAEHVLDTIIKDEVSAPQEGRPKDTT